MATTRERAQTAKPASRTESKAYAAPTARVAGPGPSIAFLVRGLPIPQGSTRTWVTNGRPVITSAAKGLSVWRRLVADVAQDYAPPQLWEGPIRMDLTFGLPKPKSAPKRKRVWPDKRPDLDKLTRAVLDALTHVMFVDDSQVVEIHASKDYGPPGVAIELRRVLDSEAHA